MNILIKVINLISTILTFHLQQQQPDFACGCNNLYLRYKFKFDPGYISN